MLRRIPLSAALALMLVAVACASGSHHGSASPQKVVTSASGASSAPVAPSASASTSPHTSAAREFLQRYVTDDGRVLRHDQGGDIVSEAQAYGMLIAEIAGDSATTHTIWTWTQAHLQNANGLIAWHATGGGTVLDSQSATDADVLIAYALLHYTGTDADTLHQAGRRIAAAVFAHESVKLPGGNPVLTAGPWAVPAAIVDPSYWMPSVFDALATMTGDQRWSRSANSAISLVSQATDGGKRLPPDWARLQGGALAPTAAPSGGPPAQYGLDAQRIAVWFAASCTASARKLAVVWWSVLSQDDHGSAIALSLDGQVVNPAKNPLSMVAAAAAAKAAGDSASTNRLLAEAAAQSAQTPTYYGDAWLALGQALLGGKLAPCS